MFYLCVLCYKAHKYIHLNEHSEDYGVKGGLSASFTGPWRKKTLFTIKHNIKS